MQGDREVLEKARLYVQREENKSFASQVEKLIEKHDIEELRECFSSDISFGTGGLRAIVGGGCNRINPYNIRRVGQGLANYLRKQRKGEEISVVVGCDSRHYSKLFAEETALLMAANGIKAYLFPSTCPTPLLSFAISQLRATAGVMITASHNPPEYNGYKVYWSDGAQVTKPHDLRIVEEMGQVTIPLKASDKQEATRAGLLEFVSPDVERRYQEILLEQVLTPGNKEPLKVVYTPLHGVGGSIVPELLRKWGAQVSTVAEQLKPDGDFPTVKSPNPEEDSALTMALQQARTEGAELILATDPDADRVRAAVLHKGEYHLLDGNQLGVLLVDYVFGRLSEKGQMPPQPAFVNTVVTTELQSLVAESYGVTTFCVLTGFKHIGTKIRSLEESESYNFVFGCEESCGFLLGTSARDKDGVSASLLTAEMTLWNRQQGRSLLDHLQEIHQRHGYYKDVLVSETFKGAGGLEAIKGFMERMRQESPTHFAGITVASMEDFLFPRAGRDLPLSDVLQYHLMEKTRITMRPSGTEPKIKFYISVREEPSHSPEEAASNLEEKASRLKETLLDLLYSAFPEKRE